MSERSEIERLAVEAMAKYEQALKDRHHGGVAAGEFVDDMRRILALAAPEETAPLPWPGIAGTPVVNELACSRYCVCQESMGGVGWVINGPTCHSPSAAILLWNRVVKSLAPTTPEGWREVVVDGGQVVLFHDQTAWLCYSATGSVVQGDTRKTGESDADLLARLNPPPGTPVIRVRRASQ